MAERRAHAAAPLPHGKHCHYFLSHRKNHSKLGGVPEQVAKNVHDSLELLGYVGFFDIDDLTQITPEALDEHVSKSCAMIAFVNDETAESKWCTYEWDCAKKHGIPIKCIVDLQRFFKQDVLNTVKDTFPHLLTFQWAEFTERYRRQCVEELCEFLDGILEEMGFPRCTASANAPIWPWNLQGAARRGRSPMPCEQDVLSVASLRVPESSPNSSRVTTPREMVGANSDPLARRVGVSPREMEYNGTRSECTDRRGAPSSLGSRRRSQHKGEESGFANGLLRTPTDPSKSVKRSPASSPGCVGHRSRRSTGSDEILAACAQRVDSADGSSCGDGDIGVDVEETFKAFTSSSKLMEQRAFAKLCRDCHLLDKGFKDVDADLIFRQVVPQRCRFMDLAMFDQALGLVAVKKGVHKEFVARKVADSTGPSLNATKAEMVRFHDDKTTYTGTSLHGGPDNPLPPSRSRTSFDDLQLAPKSDSDETIDIERSFKAFATSVNGSQVDKIMGQNLDGKGFVKLCKDCHLIDRRFTVTDVDLIFARVLPNGQRRMDLAQFEKALKMIAEKKAMDEMMVRRAIADTSGPTRTGTKADSVRLHDDRSTYTGIHAS